MSEQQYRGTLASGGTFVADGQGLRILDPAGNQLAEFGRDVISGVKRDGQIVTVERQNDTVVTLTTASITDAVGLEQYVRDTIVAPLDLPDAASAAPGLAFDAIDDDVDAQRPQIISRPEGTDDIRSPRHDMPDPVPTSRTDTSAPVRPSAPSAPPPSSYSDTARTQTATQTADEESGGGRRLWLWGCLGCGGLVILSIICIAVLIAAGAVDPDDFDGDDATPTPFVIVVTEPASEETAEEPAATAQGEDPTAADGEPTASTDSGGSSEPSPEGVLAVGESGTLGGMNVTLVGSRTDTGGTVAPDDGNEYLILRFDIENTNPDPVTVSTLLQFNLEGEDGADIDLSFFADYEAGLDSEVASGATLSGEIAFEVPQGGGPFFVIYTEPFGEETLIWQI